MKSPLTGKLLLAAGLMLLLSGCATTEVTQRKTLSPVVARQGVTLGIQTAGERLTETLGTAESPLVKSASEQLFNKVVLLPKEARYMQPKEIQSAKGVDYILSVSISDISVSGGLNRYWGYSLPLIFFKVYMPIVTFQPEVALDVTLRDAGTGAFLLQKQFTESSSDHYAPSDPGPKVRELISLTINNALVSILRESQQSIATARQGKK